MEEVDIISELSNFDRSISVIDDNPENIYSHFFSLLNHIIFIIVTGFINWTLHAFSPTLVPSI